MSDPYLLVVVQVLDGVSAAVFGVIAVGIGLFLPPIGVGLLMALRFADISVTQHFRAYWPYLVALFAGLLILIERRSRGRARFHGNCARERRCVASTRT